MSQTVFITGAGGYIGGLLVKALSADRGAIVRIIACDIRPPRSEDRFPGVEYIGADIRDPALSRALGDRRPDTVVHLAAVVNPGKNPDRAFLHSVEVEGTRNVLDACLGTGVRKFIYTSSGAAYGYCPDNPEWIDEQDPLRGNPEFAYSDHKRQVEEILADYRRRHPELKQLIFRPGTILGKTAKNQITDLFDRRWILGLMGCEIPFVLIWDMDVVTALIKGIQEDTAVGIYNMAGDGILSMKEMARLMGKPYVALPVWLLKAGLGFMKALRLTQYGPEQVNFLRYRPVLSNRRLKEAFGFIPQKTTREVFQYFLECRRHVSVT
jgi:UDP-glucose 4-epimerase